MRRFHRWLGTILVLPLVLWIATGVLFHVKHRYDEAYEALAVPPESVTDWSRATVAPAEVLASGLADAPLTLAAHPSGRLAYFGRRGDAPVAIDAQTGRPIEPADDALARRWLAAAIARSPHASRYGVEVGSEEAREPSARTGADDPVLVVRTSGDKTVRIDRVTGEIRQSGALNSFIDATYAVHYLQWTPWPALNVALVLVAVPLVLLLAFTGVRLLLQKPAPLRSAPQRDAGRSRG
ncbi:MAG: PepSY domain-containing protein [Planctomycetes bacterium]|nr:PepSY domain-containing protein [Planctomycetota bacterium]